MQDTELFMELAAIAGVFVGFGALIAVRSGGATDAYEVAYVRGVVFMGLLAVVAALAPVTLGRYALDEHQVLALSGVVLVVGLGGGIIAMTRTPEWASSEWDVFWPRWVRVAVMAVTVPWFLAMLIIPVVIALGVAPGLEAALYFTDLVLILLSTAWLLLQMVFRVRRPASV